MKRTSVLLCLHSRGPFHIVGLYQPKFCFSPLISVCLFLQSSPNETNSNIESKSLQKPVLFSNSAVLDEVPSTPRLPRPHMRFWANV